MTREKSYAVHWREEDYCQPPARLTEQANVCNRDIFDTMSLDRFPDYYEDFAAMLDWDRVWHTVLDTSDAPCWKWFVGGRLNASYNCIDRHLGQYRNKTAIYYVPEPTEEPIQSITYQALYRRVNEMAALLRDHCGLAAGDRVTLHLPMTPELPVTMLACARLGVIHSQVYGGFSGTACGDRIADSGSEYLITMDAYYRNGKLIDHKPKADVACEAARKQGQHVKKVFIWQRSPGKYSSAAPLVSGRDFLLNELLGKYRGQTVAPVSLPAEGILFLMYTSGTTAKPKGVQHSIGGYLSYVAAMSHMILDIKPTDVYWCMADIGWITGHSFIVYGPLALAATTVIYEGVPTFPDAGRVYRIAEELGVNIFYTAPTAIRMMRKAGPEEPRKYKHSFKLMGTVGEPIEPEVWKWYYHEVGRGEAAIVDTYWQTENGGFLCSTVPGLHPMKPGSAGPAVPGLHAVILDDDGNELQPGEGKAGNICFCHPWPGSMQTLWQDRDRYVATYYQRYCKSPDSRDWRDWPYLTGDAAMQSTDGYYRILGRIDDIINVAGHRMGTKEIESAVLTVPEVAEAAAVGVRDELKGSVPELYVSLKPNLDPGQEIAAAIHGKIEEMIGAIAKPRNLWIVPDLPKTRSGKIMRRVLASISNGDDIGDATTLADPGIVTTIRDMVQERASRQIARELPGHG